MAQGGCFVLHQRPLPETQFPGGWGQLLVARASCTRLPATCYRKELCKALMQIIGSPQTTVRAAALQEHALQPVKH
jgi:hypothetical protein